MLRLARLIVLLALSAPQIASAQYCLPGRGPCIPTSPYLPGSPEDPTLMQQNTNRRMEELERRIDEQKGRLDAMQPRRGAVDLFCRLGDLRPECN